MKKTVTGTSAAQLTELRDLGVKSFNVSAHGWAVEFFEHAGPAKEQTLPEAVEPGACKCGHSEAHHNPEGLCLEGCDEGQCKVGA